MQQLVQRHLDAKDCLVLLRTSHALAKAVVRHHTRRQRHALTWTWQAASHDAGNSMDSTPQAATAAALLVRWAPAELHVALRGTTRGKVGTAISLPPALLPLITSLRLSLMHLTPATMGLLHRCRRLHALGVDGCPHEDLAEEDEPTRSLAPLPLLRTFRCVAPERTCWNWPLQAWSRCHQRPGHLSQRLVRVGVSRHGRAGLLPWQQGPTARKLRHQPQARACATRS